MLKKNVICLIRFFVKLVYNVSVTGEENLNIDGGFVFTANHRSNWDVFVIFAMINKDLNFMAKAELFENKIVAWVLRKFGAFPVKRNTNDIGAVKQALQILNNDKILAIFPQGTRSAELKVDEAKAGAVLFASRCKKPIVPVAIAGEYKIGNKLNIHIGEPIYFEERKLSQEELNENTIVVMKKIKELAETV